MILLPHGFVNKFQGQKFLSELGEHLTSATDDSRDASFLFQRISILVQFFNAICFQDNFSQPEEIEILAASEMIFNIFNHRSGSLLPRVQKYIQEECNFKALFLSSSL